MFNFTGTYTDFYQLTMANAYYQNGMHEKIAYFDYFFRKAPFNNSYAVFAGLETILDALENLKFSAEDLTYLKELGFAADFINYLAKFRFQGSVYAAKEGSVVFPYCSNIIVKGNIIEAQLIETLLLNIVNFETLIATKARKIKLAAGDKILVDFGLRRAQATGGYFASRAAIIGGFSKTSNVVAGRDFAIPVSGTMAHSYVQSFDSELESFRSFIKTWPKNAVLLIDTYDTINSGLKNAIIIAKELEKQGEKLFAVRLDSGSFSDLSKYVRNELDKASLAYVKIIASSDLDENIIAKLVEDNAPIDIYGVGTKLVTGVPDAALGGVYKLSSYAGHDKIKLSEEQMKTTIPGFKQVFRIVDELGMYKSDFMAHQHEKEHKELYDLKTNKKIFITNENIKPLLALVMENGRRINSIKSLAEIAKYSEKAINNLKSDYKKFTNPKAYTVGLSKKLLQTRENLKSKIARNVES